MSPTSTSSEGPHGSRHHRLLRRWSQLLQLEAQEQRTQTRQGAGLPLVDGVMLSETSSGSVYRFEALTATSIPEGSRGVLRVETDEFDVEVLERGDEEITLFISSADGLPPSVPTATLATEPWFLTEELAARLAELSQDAIPSGARRLLDRFETAPAAVGRIHPVPNGIDLNPNQEAAVAAALCEPLWWIWGPPGTGKTTSLGALVAEMVIRGERVLVTAHSNVAVDTAMMATAEELEVRGHQSSLTNGSVVRAGPAMLAPAIQRGLSSRELVLREHPDLASQLSLVRRALRTARSSELATLRRQHAALLEEIRRLEKLVVSRARVLFCTLPKATIDETIRSRTFTAVVVDEVSMALAPQIVFAASLADERVTLRGDFRQLPPIVTARDEEVQRDLGRDIFAHAGIPGSIDRGVISVDVTMLTTQHRMHPLIRSVVSDLSYLGRLEDGRRVASETAAAVRSEPRPGSPIVVVNTRLLGGRGWRTRDQSRINPVSALWATQLAYDALRTVDHVALLAPYRGQVHLLTALVRDLKLGERVTVGTIHRMQGSEAPVVIFDIVDALPLGVPGRLLQGELGRRLVNVAFSRARSKLVVLGDVHALRPDPKSKVGHVLAALHMEHGWDPTTIERTSAPSLRYVDDAAAVASTYVSETRGSPAVTWVGDHAPSWLTSDLVALSRAPEPRQTDQAVVLAGDCAWVFGERPDRTWSGFRVASRRFADALYEVLEGGGRRPLAPCPRHNVPTVIVAHRQNIRTVCPEHRCTTSHRATPADLDLWARYIDIRCPDHGEPMVSARRSTWFYRCPHDGCRRTAAVS